MHNKNKQEKKQLTEYEIAINKLIEPAHREAEAQVKKEGFSNPQEYSEKMTLAYHKAMDRMAHENGLRTTSRIFAEAK
jgi:hypothetical protein